MEELDFFNPIVLTLQLSYLLEVYFQVQKKLVEINNKLIRLASHVLIVIFISISHFASKPM